ncbi:LytR/AlgR family response regulator transcription factor [Acetonema longum]|uniref:LytR/AlgR family transcriptional regulator n=1 Tax=Acetonema longum DSM 6540 TaxID=1009370 RepID=F7NHU0_9FIRM|nr:LytTR family DNA-binding domain-containing protein [Acetonema longum]EGO64465.1 LytR/AlgR family transcriptional regulator [Acetonema longum DSM 6540]
MTFIKTCRALIVDDELPARDELRFLLSPYADIEIVGEADSSVAALELAAELRPQLMFLDIQMRGMDGYETAKELRRLAPNMLVVFATAYDEYAVKAFELDAVDYLLKPFEPGRLAHTVDRIRHIAREQTWQSAAEKVDALLQAKPRLRKLPVYKQGKIVLLDFQDIVFAQSAGDTLEIVTEATTYTISNTLADLEDRLRGEPFLRIHKSYIVNLEKISEIIPWFKGTYWLKMSNLEKSQIPVSRKLVKTLKEVLGMP